MDEEKPQEVQPDPEELGRLTAEREEAQQAEPIEMPKPEDGPAKTEPTEAEQPLMTQCAFLVYLDDNGHWIANGEVINRPIMSARPATFQDFGHAASTIQRDLVTNDVANGVMARIGGMAQQAAQAQEFARLKAMTEGNVPGGGIDLSNLKRS